MLNLKNPLNMKGMLKHSACCLLFATVCLTATAQKKELTNDQYFKNNFIDITKALPVVTNWVDDNHFIIQKDGNKIIVPFPKLFPFISKGCSAYFTTPFSSKTITTLECKPAKTLSAISKP